MTRIDVAFAPLHQGLEPLLALIEILEIGKPTDLTGGNFVEGVFHTGGETRIHQIGEMLLQQGGHGKSREAGNQGIGLQRGIAAVNDRADDAGVGGGASDALLLQHLDQGGFAVTGRGLGLVTERFNGAAIGSVADLEGWQQNLLALQGGIGVVAALDIGPEKAWEINPLARGPEGAISHLQINRQHGQTGVGHLGGDGALPDEFVERQIPALQTGLPRGPERLPRRPNGFVGLLGIAGFGGELAGGRTEVVLAITLCHTAAGGLDGLLGEIHRVCTHVSDEAPLIEGLGGAHGVPG